MSHLDVLDAAVRAGIHLTVSISVVGGSKEVLITPQQAERFIANPKSVCAELLGMSEEDYAEYIASKGTIYCEGTTTNGKPCRNNVPGQSLLPPEQWISARSRGGYCPTHGG